MGKYWIKYWIESLHDQKMARLPDWLWRKFYEFCLFAGDLDAGGLLPPVEDMAWILHVPDVKLSEALEALSKVGADPQTHRLGLVHASPEGWIVTNFAKRQQGTSSTERVRKYRKRLRNEDETVTFQSCNEVETALSSSVSSLSDSESSLLKPREDSLNSKDEESFQGEDFTFYEQNIGILTPMIVESIKDAQDEYPPGWIRDAIEIAAKANKRSWSYCEAILRRWKAEGKQSKLNGRTSRKKSAMEIVDEWGKELGFE